MTAEPITAPVTQDLVRSVPFELVREDGDPGDGLTFRGYAAVFNSPTQIDSWEGRFTEQVAPGAFKKSLRERTPVLQFDHGSHPMIGSIPLGSITAAREDEQGVFVEARLADNWLVQPVRDAIASGAVDGMSFRFEVVRDRWEDADGTPLRTPDAVVSAISRSDGDMPKRTLLEVKSREMGPVVFPAYAGTSASVRSVTFDSTKPLTDEQRSALAHLVYAADAAPTDLPETPEDTEQAVDHETRDNDTPQDTGDPAVEHESAGTDLRAAIQRRRALHAPRLRFALEGVHRYE